MLSRADYYNQWLPSSSYSQWAAKFNATPTAQVRDWIVGGNRDNPLSGGEYDRWLVDFDTSYAKYSQGVQLAGLKDQLAQQEQAQVATVADLQAQQTARLQRINSVGNAVAASLRILAAPQSTAPTAAVAPTQKKKRGAPTAASSLRMGATASGRGAGTNLAI